MDPTSLFFSRLRRLAVTLEAETESLQAGYRTRADHDDTEIGMGSYHTLCTEVADLKGEVRASLGRQRSREAEVSGFLAACGVMQRRLSEDLCTLREHFEKYGYQAPPNTQVRDQAPEPADPRVEEEEEPAFVEEEDGGATERKDPFPPSTPPQSAPPPTVDQMRTPLLSDFGLSEVDLRRMLIGAQGCPEAPPMPVLSLPPLPSSLATPLPPTLLLTPKCALRMEEEELRTPQLSDFGISEVDLKRMLRGADGCPEAPPMPVLSLPPLPSSLATPLPSSLATPLPPALLLLTPKCALRMEDDEELRTPQMEDFGISEQTLGLNLDLDLRQLAPRSTNTRDPPATLDLTPEMKNLTPEMPKMESMFTSTLFSRSARGACGSGDPGVGVYGGLEADGPTQDFNLRTPRVRLAYQDPPTPEMPDLSSVTQDICKLVSRAELKKQTTATVAPIPRMLGKENRAALLPLVVNSEFQRLPRYLRQMSLSSLNDSIHKINTAAAAKHHHGEALQFPPEELKRVTGAGTKAPVYFLCLEELQRLEHVQSAGSSSVYKLLPQH
ncbi:unnamed protein product [Merluccius merluccius]